MATTGQATEARHPHPLTKGAPGLRLVPANQTTRCGLWRFNLAEHPPFLMDLLLEFHLSMTFFMNDEMSWDEMSNYKIN